MMNDAPKRIQRRRAKGWRMPAGAIYVGRPTRYGNPFRCWGEGCALRGGVRETWCCVLTFEAWLRSGIEGRPSTTGTVVGGLDALAGYPARTALVEGLPALRGRDLACWCPLGDTPCHADVLLRMANA